MSDSRWGGFLRRARAAAVVNWPVKLTALVLSTLLWAVVAAEEPTTQLVPVSVVIDAPPGREITSPIPPVRALYQGPARELIKLYSSPPVARVALPDTLTGSAYTLELAPADLRIARDIDAAVQDLQPRVLALTLDDIVRRTVRVVPRVQIAPDSGFALVSGVAVTPATVTIRGPEEAVRAVEQVETISLELTNVQAPVRRTVQLDTIALGLARSIPSEVEISAEVAPVSERVLMGVPVTIRSDRGGWTADPPAVIATVRGPSARLVHLTRDSIDVVAIPTGIGGAERLVLEVVPPAGVTVRLTPDSVTVERRTRG